MFACFLAAGCSRKLAPPVGGGEHRVTGISILAKENNTLFKDRNPATLRTGERLPLRVIASWAIPYVDDVTEKTLLLVSDSSLGVLGSHAIFTAQKPGKVTIDAVLRVVSRAGGHEVLSPQESAGTDPVVTFHDQIVLNITE